MKKKTYKWVVFYIESKEFDAIHKYMELAGFHYKIEIPTIDILKKKSKGKNIYEKKPLLFNYAFINIPTEKAFNRVFLNNFVKKVPGIRGWLRSTESIFEKKKRKRVDSADFDDFSKPAIVKFSEIRRLKKYTNLDYHMKDEIVNLKIGSYVTLKGYPFEGIPATILDINISKKMVKLELYPENGKMIMNLPLDNVASSIYLNSDPDTLSPTHVEDLKTINNNSFFNMI